jgi:hypothetical protein
MRMIFGAIGGMNKFTVYIYTHIHLFIYIPLYRTGCKSLDQRSISAFSLGNSTNNETPSANLKN